MNLKENCCMAYNKILAKRVRTLLQKTSGILEKQMFGGVGFLIHGNMACGILNDDLIIRVGSANYDAALKSSHAREFDVTGRVMKGWVMVSSSGYDSDKDLSSWVERGVSFARSLPGK